MAFEALVGRRAGSELVARIALRCAIEGLMCLREGPGRNLSAGACGPEEYRAEEKQYAEEPKGRDPSDPIAP
jgi:hypothetical protein